MKNSSNRNNGKKTKAQKIPNPPFIRIFVSMSKMNIMKKQILLFLLIFSGCMQSAAAQSKFTFKRFDASDGMSSNYIMDLAQDKYGYIWIASESGLSRFDGNRFTQYSTYNSDISSNELNALFYNEHDDALWIGTQRNGICVFDCKQQRFVKYYKSGDMITDDVTSIVPAKDGGLWIVHYHLGIDYYDNKDKTFTPYRTGQIKGLEGNFWCAADDGKGHLLIGHNANGLSIIDLDTKTCKNYTNDPDDPHSLPGNTVKSIFIDSMKNIWIGTTQGLALFNMAKEEFTVFHHDPHNPHSLISDQINDINQDKEGKIWICAYMGGVSVLDLHENTFTRPEDTFFENISVTGNRHGLSSPNACCFLQDHFGNIWIGNYRRGIDFLSYRQTDFQILDCIMLKDGRIAGKQVWGLSLDDKGRLWAGGENEIIAFKDKSIEKVISLKDKTIPYTHVSFIHKDKTGMLWLGMYRNGLLRCNPETGETVRIQMDNPYAEVCSFYEEDKKLWIGTQDGLYSYQDGRIAKEEAINRQLLDQMIHGITKDRQGKLWLGTFGKGLAVFDQNEKLVKRIDTSNGLTSNAVNSIYQDSKGELWIATRNGIVHIKDTETYGFSLYGNEQGLGENNVRAITEDAKGQIWLSTNGGISLWKSDKKRFYNYTWHQGVPQNDFMDASVCRDKDGTLYFGSQDGVCYFNPDNLSHHNKIPPVKITEIKSYNNNSRGIQESILKPTDEEELKVSYDNNTISISFNVMDFTLSPQTEYSYSMEGLNKTWFDVQDENTVMFRNLPPGTYTFKVKARLRNQTWKDNFTSVRITVVPPLWLTWYAKLLYVVGCACIFYLILRFYKRKLELESRLSLEYHQHENDKKLNNERLRFYTNITHELRTPLTLILGPLEDLLADKTLSPKHLNKISIIRDSANRLLNLINQILEFRKTETENRKLKVAQDDLSELIQEIGIKYKELNQNPNVEISIEKNTDNTFIYFDREIITIIIDNLMSNALKYTPKGKITLSISSSEEAGVLYTEISVKDTGHGISKESLNHIFERYYQGDSKYQASGSGIGLSLVKSLADIHQAIVEVKSEPDKGSEFILRLLTENTYPNAERRTIATKARKGQTSANETNGETDENKPIILVVEDNRDISEYIRSSFEPAFEVLIANDGKEGWEIASSRIPNIVVSDIMMPVMDGIELCRTIKEDMRTSHIPVILLTAKDTLQDKEEGYAAGADSFISKPFSARLLSSRINNILSNRRKMAASIVASGTDAEHGQKNMESQRQKLNRLDREFLEKVTAIIEENLSIDKMDVAFIADKMCMSHSTLYRKIKGLTDMSVNEFVRKVKMQKSAELLASGEHSIAEISDLTGFSSVAYFRQCFKDEYNMTPTEYLKQKKS